MLFGIVLAAIWLAAFLSRRIISTTEHPSRLTRDLPVKLASDRQIAWPESVIFARSPL